MIISIRVDNYKVYQNPNELSLKADMRIKKFNTNVHKEKKFNVLKSACIYGGNNVGKTCILDAIASIKNVLSSEKAVVSTNIFSDNNVCSLGITFLYNKEIYSYVFKYDTEGEPTKRRAFIYERFSKVTIDKYGNEIEKLLFIRDVENDRYEFEGNDDIAALMGSLSSNNIFIYTISSEKYAKVKKYKEILSSFASTIDIVDMNNIPVDKTLRILKDNESIKRKTIELIKQADIEIDDYDYSNAGNVKISISEADSNNMPRELALRIQQVEDMLKLYSVHRGRVLPSLAYDSTGTKKLVALASYIVDAIENGRTLVIDELDSSLHFKLTRAIVSFFNNEINENGQLIAAVHDISLLDCKRLFRKDQIWFVNKDNEGSHLTSLAEYTSLKDNIRSDSDIMAKYESGFFGQLPEPDFISAMIGDVAND